MTAGVRPARLAARVGTPRSPAPVEDPTRRTLAWVIGGMLIATSLLLYALAGSLVSSSTSYGLIVAPLLLLLTAPIIRREERRKPGFDIGGILFAALGVKLLTAWLRLYMVEGIYNNNGDSNAYDHWGRILASAYRDFDFSIDPQKSVPGSGFIRIVTGVVYAIIGSDKFGGFMVFSFFAFIGCYLLYRAFVIAVPDGDHRRYALLVFFWPSLAFWPSSIGKEGWMLLCIGVAAWGMARLFVRGRGGYVALGLGALGMYGARPHVAILLVAAAVVGAVSALIFHSAAGVKSVSFVSKLAGVAVVLVLGALLAPRVATFLDVDDVGGSGFSQALEFTTDRTTEGDSRFEAVEINSPLDYPWALMTSVLRPFPHEVTNGQSAVSAAEGVALVGLLALSMRRLRRLPADFVKVPYAAAAIAYVMMFAYVFASIGNFGILVRQRTQMLPFLFVLLALGAARDRRQSHTAPDADADDEPALPRGDTWPPPVRLRPPGAALQLHR